MNDRRRQLLRGVLAAALLLSLLPRAAAQAGTPPHPRPEKPLAPDSGSGGGELPKTKAPNGGATGKSKAPKLPLPGAILPGGSIKERGFVGGNGQGNGSSGGGTGGDTGGGTGGGTGGSGSGGGSDGSASNGGASNGSASNGGATSDSANNGSANNGKATSGSASAGNATNGSTSNGGTTSGAASNGNSTSGSASNMGASDRGVIAGASSAGNAGDAAAAPEQQLLIEVPADSASARETIRLLCGDGSAARDVTAALLDAEGRILAVAMLDVSGAPRLFLRASR